MRETDFFISRYEYFGNENVGNIFQCSLMLRADGTSTSWILLPATQQGKISISHALCRCGVIEKEFWVGRISAGLYRVSCGRIDSGNLFVSVTRASRANSASETPQKINWAILISGKWMLTSKSWRRG